MQWWACMLLHIAQCGVCGNCTDFHTGSLGCGRCGTSCEGAAKRRSGVGPGAWGAWGAPWMLQPATHSVIACTSKGTQAAGCGSWRAGRGASAGAAGGGSPCRGAAVPGRARPAVIGGPWRVAGHTARAMAQGPPGHGAAPMRVSRLPPRLPPPGRTLIAHKTPVSHLPALPSPPSRQSREVASALSLHRAAARSETLNPRRQGHRAVRDQSGKQRDACGGAPGALCARGGLSGCPRAASGSCAALLAPLGRRRGRAAARQRPSSPSPRAALGPPSAAPSPAIVTSRAHRPPSCPAAPKLHNHPCSARARGTGSPSPPGSSPGLRGRHPPRLQPSDGNPLRGPTGP